MNVIDNLSNDANQVSHVVLDDGTTADLTLIYRPAIQRWSMDVAYKTFQATNLNVCLSPNMLRPWSLILPFGIACVTSDGVDPVYIDDFANGRAQLLILNGDDMAMLETEVYGAGS